eukprot:TRINITY_DN4676_c0_g1_i1.p1 TRINITY_DN4676_c0_g1~~TRINITY_DN4676_c0_g1_i1.p1  ORF type:complete len:546 (-),score=57.87 TRINITY_DN4676_c0_g1_i1:53-1690(-)
MMITRSFRALCMAVVVAAAEVEDNDLLAGAINCTFSFVQLSASVTLHNMELVEPIVRPQDLLVESGNLLQATAKWYSNVGVRLEHKAGERLPQSLRRSFVNTAAWTDFHKDKAGVHLPSGSNRFNLITFAGRMKKSHQEGRLLKLHTDHDRGPDIVSALCWYFASLVFFGVVIGHCGSSWHVDIPEGNDPEIRYAKGRPCYTWCCGCLLVLASLFAFYVCAASIAMANQEVKTNPETTEVVNGKETAVIRYPIVNPGLRSIQASESVLLSALIACFVVFGRRRLNQVHISASLLAKFMLRGATFSLVIAMILEMTGMALVATVGAAALPTQCLMMLVVGFAEEYGKLVAVTCGICIAPSVLKTRSGYSCCSSVCCDVLVETPLAFAIAGLSAGFGFMTLENAGYVVSAASQPPKVYPDLLDDGQSIHEERMNGGRVTLLTSVTIAVRVLLNIHPWLTGYSAIRLASKIFKDDPANACKFGDILQALWPSAVIHALYDLGLTVLPGGLGMLLPPVFWWYSRRSFVSCWENTAVVNESASVGSEPLH